MSRLMVMGFAFAMLLFAVPAAAQVSDGKCPDPKDLTDPDCQPPEPPKNGADCSPGFYKNHLTAWCDADAEANGIDCPAGFGFAAGTFSCGELVELLSAELGATVAERNYAKACLDARSPADICSE